MAICWIKSKNNGVTFTFYDSIFNSILKWKWKRTEALKNQKSFVRRFVRVDFGNIMRRKHNFIVRKKKTKSETKNMFILCVCVLEFVVPLATGEQWSYWKYDFYTFGRRASKRTWLPEQLSSTVNPKRVDISIKSENHHQRRNGTLHNLQRRYNRKIIATIHFYPKFVHFVLNGFNWKCLSYIWSVFTG